MRFYGEYRGDITRYVFSLSARTLRSLPIINDLVGNLSARAFFPDQPYDVVVGLCPAGLREIALVDQRQLRLLLWERVALNPTAKLTFVSHDELRKDLTCP